MDGKLGVQHGGHHQHNGVSKPPVHGGGRRGGRQQGGGGKGIKVVYISSPMKLTASVEEFRAVVQELTGRDSNVADHDLAVAPSSSSFGRFSPSGAGARALPQTMATASAAGSASRAPGYAAAPPPAFQGMYEQVPGSLLYGQNYW